MVVSKAILSYDKVAQMSSALDMVHPRYGLLWDLGIETGLRISDLLRLRVRDFSHTLLHVREVKTGKTRDIDIGAPLRLNIRAYFDAYAMRDNDCLFWRRRNCRETPMSRQWANIIIRQAAEMLGLQNITAHSMRRTYACRVYVNTGSLDVTRRALNHRDVSTTISYVIDVLRPSESA